MTAFIDALSALSLREIGSIRKLDEDGMLPARLLGAVPDSVDEWPYVLVARLYARLIQPVPRGQTLLSLYMAARHAGDPSGIWEKRFMGLLDTPDDPERLYHELQPVTRVAREAGVALDWDTLLTDLREWDSPDRVVQRRWARQFWTAGDPPEQSEDPELTIPEIVKRYELGDYYDRMLRRIAGTERLPARKSGRTWLIRESDIEHWLETKPRPGRQPAQ
jgi:CRISPR type I-E-associated protein CasB/Cse2